MSAQEKCPFCGKTGTLVRKNMAHEEFVGPYCVEVQLSNALACASCGDPVMTSGEEAEVQRRVALYMLGVFGPLSAVASHGSVIRYARKAAAIHKAEVSEALGCSHEEYLKAEQFGSRAIQSKLLSYIAGRIADRINANDQPSESGQIVSVSVSGIRS